MKTELIALAREKEFCIPMGKGELYYYLWMCELQKWLREVHKMEVTITPAGRENMTIDWAMRVVNLDNFYALSPMKFHNNSYEIALEAGLYNALSLIKKE